MCVCVFVHIHMCTQSICMRDRNQSVCMCASLHWVDALIACVIYFLLHWFSVWQAIVKRRLATVSTLFNRIQAYNVVCFWPDIHITMLLFDAVVVVVIIIVWISICLKVRDWSSRLVSHFNHTISKKSSRIFSKDSMYCHNNTPVVDNFSKWSSNRSDQKLS